MSKESSPRKWRKFVDMHYNCSCEYSVVILPMTASQSVEVWTWILYIVICFDSQHINMHQDRSDNKYSMDWLFRSSQCGKLKKTITKNKHLEWNCETNNSSLTPSNPVKKYSVSIVLHWNIFNLLLRKHNLKMIFFRLMISFFHTHLYCNNKSCGWISSKMVRKSMSEALCLWTEGLCQKHCTCEQKVCVRSTVLVNRKSVSEALYLWTESLCQKHCTCEQKVCVRSTVLVNRNMNWNMEGRSQQWVTSLDHFHYSTVFIGSRKTHSRAASLKLHLRVVASENNKPTGSNFRHNETQDNFWMFDSHGQLITSDWKLEISYTPTGASEINSWV